jgi:hypothetical protein
MSTKADDKTTAKEEAAEQAFLAKQAGSPEQKNVSEFQMNSTETATISQDDFWRTKLCV